MLPLIIGGIAVLGLLGITLSSSLKKEIYISALGPIGSGKTTFHNYFRKTNYKNATISHNELDEITILIGDKKVILSKGKDISGSETAVTSYYKKEVNKSDYVFFLFNSNKILNDVSYCVKTNARLNFINKINNKDAKIILIASHYDKVENINNSKMLIWEKIEKIANEGKINKPHFLNLTDKSQLEQLKKELL